MSVLVDDHPKDIQLQTGSNKMEDSRGTKTKQHKEEEEVVTSAVMEPSTLQWLRDRQTGGQTEGKTGKGDRMSVRSDMSLREASSWTESE